MKLKNILLLARRFLILVPMGLLGWVAIFASIHAIDKGGNSHVLELILDWVGILFPIGIGFIAGYLIGKHKWKPRPFAHAIDDDMDFIAERQDYK